MIRLKKLKILLISAMTIQSLHAFGADDTAPPTQGELDLSQNNWVDNPTINISGYWAVYWQKLIEFKDLANLEPDEFISLSSPWSDQNKHQYATFYLKIKILNDSPLLGLKVSNPSDQYRIFVNDKLLSSRRSHLQKNNPPSQYIDTLILPLSPVDGRYINIIMQVTRQGSWPSKTKSEIKIGTWEALNSDLRNKINLFDFIIALFSIMAIYHALSYFVSHQKSLEIWLSIFCFGCLLVICVISGKIIQLLPDSLTKMYWQYIYYGYTILMVSIYQITTNLYSIGSRLHLTKILFLLALTSFLCTTLLTNNIHYIIHPLISAMGLILLFGLSNMVKQAVRERDTEIIIFAIAILGSIVVSIGDHFDAWQQQTTYMTTSIGLTALAFITTYILKKRNYNNLKKMETRTREVLLLNKELYDKDKSRTLYFNNISHELRTPLNSIMGFLNLINEGTYGQVSERVQRQIKKTQNLTEDLKDQVTSILDLAKSKSGKMGLYCEKTNLEEIYQKAVTLGEGLQIQNNDSSFQHQIVDTGSPFICDQEKLLTLIRNLLGNAFKFKSLEKSNRIDFRMIRNEKTLKIEVSDTGLGIAKKNIDKIFSNFHQVNELSNSRIEGTGIGLALVKSIIEILGGKIETASTLGVGTSITLTIPEQVITVIERKHESLIEAIDQPNMEYNQSASCQDGIGAIEPASILVVDDNEINLEVISDLLTSYSHKVTQAQGGEKAIEILMVKRDIELVLLDLMMPGTSGEDVLKWMRGIPALEGIPVIVITARASQEDKIQGLNIGADDYLAKPIVNDELILRVHNTLNRIRFAKNQRGDTENKESSEEYQTTLLPRFNSEAPISSVSHYNPTGQNGGDWFGYHWDKETNRIYTLIGDVTGQGFSSALISGAAAGAFRGVIPVIEKLGQELNLAESLEMIAMAINQAVIETGKHSEKYMTMAFTSIDLNTGKGSYLNAGHTAIYILKKDAVVSLLHGGAPLGTQEEPDWKMLSFQFDIGDRLFLYTDGLTGNKGPDGRNFRTGHLLKILRKYQDLNDLKVQIVGKSQAIWKNATPEDDCAFLIIRREESPKNSNKAS